MGLGTHTSDTTIPVTVTADQDGYNYSGNSYRRLGQLKLGKLLGG
jgi:hypothetical protein